MTKTAKVVLGVVIVVIVVGLGWWYFASQQSMSGNQGAYSNPAPTGTVSTTTQGGQPAQQNGAGVSAANSSDAALANDVTSIDTQMNGLNSDSASADQSMND